MKLALDPYKVADALLDQSAREYVGLTPYEMREYKAHVQAEAAEWFASDSTDPGSFLWCCKLRGVDPAEFKQTIDDRRNAKA